MIMFIINEYYLRASVAIAAPGEVDGVDDEDSKAPNVENNTCIYAYTYVYIYIYMYIYIYIYIYIYVEDMSFPMKESLRNYP